MVVSTLMWVGIGRAGDSQEGISSEQSVGWAQRLRGGKVCQATEMEAKCGAVRAGLVHGIVEGEGACRETRGEMRGNRVWEAEAQC